MPAHWAGMKASVVFLGRLSPCLGCKQQSLLSHPDLSTRIEPNAAAGGGGGGAIVVILPAV